MPSLGTIESVITNFKACSTTLHEYTLELYISREPIMHARYAHCHVSHLEDDANFSW